MVRMTLLISILLLFSLSLSAPIDTRAVIIQPEAIQPFKPLIKAIGAVECNFDTLAYSPVEQAIGYFQIRPIRVEDYNLRTNSTYELIDMFDYQIAEKVFLFYASRIGPYDFEKITRNWNGGQEGINLKSTEKYYLKVQKVLLSL